MSHDILKEWIEALRSGKYKQGKMQLKLAHKKGDQFCCLGVLCDIIDNSKWENCKMDGSLCQNYMGADIFPPEHIRIIPKNMNNSNTLRGMLSHQNDDLGWDFTKIADYIEEHVERIEVMV